MKTLSRNQTEGNLTKSNEVLRLQRTNKDIVQLSNKLKSYTCEPCTYSLYEKVQALKERMEQLRQVNNEIISSVNKPQSNIEDIADAVRKQLRDFSELRNGVFDYTRMVQSHH